MAPDVDLGELAGVVGKQLVGASRIQYEFMGITDDPCLGLELTFAGGHVLFLGVAGDGERLRISPEAWRDPFVPPLSPENAEFIQRSGRYVRVDAASVAPSLPVGDVFVRYIPIRNSFGTLAGLTLELTGSTVRFLVECDEAYLMSLEDTRFQEWGFTEDRG